VEFGAIVFLGMVGGVIYGFIHGQWEISGIAEAIKREHPDEWFCGTGMAAVLLGYIFFGWLIGTVLGVIVGIVLSLKERLDGKVTSGKLFSR